VKIVGLPQYPFLDTTLPHCGDSNSKTLTVLALAAKLKSSSCRCCPYDPDTGERNSFAAADPIFGLFNPNNGCENHSPKRGCLNLSKINPR
jgi:hypothetical protein